MRTASTHHFHTGQNPDSVSNRTSQFSDFLHNAHLLNILKKYGTAALDKISPDYVLK